MIDVARVLGIADVFVIVSAPNRRLVRTLVDEVEKAVRADTGRSPLRVEGVREQQWVLLDYGDTVVHVFLDETRRFYEIERLLPRRSEGGLGELARRRASSGEHDGLVAEEEDPVLGPVPHRP